MSASSLENEDLDNVPLVRLEDIQPRSKVVVTINNLGTSSVNKNKNNRVYETLLDDFHYESECVVDEDSDSNIGSMVSIKCDREDEESVGDDDNNSRSESELIVPEVIDHTQMEIPIKIEDNKDEIKINPPDRWPTLEILPGGVIKNADKLENDSSLYSDKVKENATNTGEMMYACAKCSQTFKYLFCLVKHVKWHEDQKKVMKDWKMGKLSDHEEELVCLKKEMFQLDKAYKRQKVEVLRRMATALENCNRIKDFFNK